MRAKRNLVWILVLAFLASGLVALGSLAAETESGVPVSEITIAIGGMADRVHYGGFANETDSADGSATDRTHALVVEANGTTRTLSRAGVSVDALRVHERYTLDGRPEPIAWTAYVDLESRSLVRFDRLSERRVGETYYEDARSEFLRVSQGWSKDFAWQGQTLRLGETLGVAECGAENPDAPDIRRTTRLWVSDAGWVDGRPALALRAEQRTHDGGQSFENSYIAMRWFVEGDPYPVMVEEWYEDLAWEPGRRAQASRWTSHEVFHQVQREAVGDPVPWQPPPADPCADAPLPLAPRSSTNVPSDSDTTLWPFPPSQAIRDIVDSPAFLPWKTEHPDARVVGFTALAPGDGTIASIQDGGMEWFITFADGTSALRASSNRARPEAPPVVQIQAEFQLAQAVDEWMPTAPVTLGHAERLWRPQQAACGNAAPAAFWGVHNPEAPGGVAPAAFRSIYVWCQTRSADPQTQPGGATPTELTTLQVSALSGGLVSQTQTYYTSASLLPIPATWAGDPGPELRRHSDSVPSALAPSLVLWGSSTLAILVLAALLVKTFTSGLLPGYAKIRDEELLRHPTRETIRTHIAQNPGIDPPRLQQQVGIPWSTLAYHLSLLERDQLVVSRVVGRHKYLFVPGAGSASERERLAILQNERTRDVWSHVQKHPGINQRALARAFAVDPKAIAWHVQRLAAVGLLRSTKEGRANRWFGNAHQGGP